MLILSSNAFSVDDQTADVISYLSLSDNPVHQAIIRDFEVEFPEYNSLEWSGSYVDTEDSGVDPEYMNWVREWLDNHTSVFWFDGEPVILEDGESLDDDDDPENLIWSAIEADTDNEAESLLLKASEV